MAWSILMRHARDDMQSVRLSALVNDSERVSALVSVHNGSETALKRIEMSSEATGHPLSRYSRILVADLSRQRMTLETLNYLLGLASAVDMKGFIKILSWGQNNFYASHKQSNADILSGNHFTFDDKSTNLPMSPARSVASKQTRFAAESDNFAQSDDHTISSFPYIQSPSVQLTKGQLQSCPSMHMALRAPSHCNLTMLTATGENALNEIHKMNKRIEMISNSIRRGEVRGASGKMLQNILVIGKGVAFSACKFVYEALRYDEDGSQALRSGLSERKMTNPQGRCMRFLSQVDPVAIHSVICDWNPEETIVVSLILNGEDSTDLIHLTESLKKWFVQGLKAHSNRNDIIWGKHIFLITASDIFYQTQSLTKTECSFLIPSFARYEAFNSTSVAGLLPLSLAFGWTITQELLHGAHDMDSHFVETNPRHNLPVLLALTDIWNDHFLASVNPGKSTVGRIVTPHMQCFISYPSFVATIEAHVCSRMAIGRTRDPYKRVGPSGVVIDGGMCGMYDRLNYQGGRPPPSEMIMAMDCQIPNRFSGINDYSRLLFGQSNEDNISNQDSLLCSFFATADVMAVGSNVRGNDQRSVISGTRLTHSGGNYIGSGASFDGSYPAPVHHDLETSNGNHPNTLLLCTRCDAFTCGQLIALAEHRSLVTARLWDIENPFAFSQVHGSIVKSKDEQRMREKLESLFQRLDLVGTLQEDDDTAGDGFKLSLAVKTLLGHYASRMHDTKKAFT